jgi:hypothetical protein
MPENQKILNGEIITHHKNIQKIPQSQEPKPKKKKPIIRTRE